jgi:diguanylate cyclase (GGDEF)-like protein/PAS domain S-box-containing protein
MRQFAARHLPTGHTLPTAEWERRHRGILVILWVLALALPLYGILRGHALAHDTVGGATLLATAVLASRERPRHAVSSALASLGLCMACGLAVHLADGAIEAHFMFFVVIIIVSLYEDWRPFLIAIAFVVLHHGVVGVFDRASAYNHPGNPWGLAAIHGAFVLAASIAAVVSWRLNEDLRTQARQASEQARASDDRFRGVFEDGPVCMALIGADGPSRGTLRRVNRTLCERFGYSEGELAGSPMSVLFDSAGETHLRLAIDDLVAGRVKVFHDELALHDRAQETFDGRLSMSLVAGSGSSGDVIVRIEDITERNRLGRELRDLADLDPLTGLFNRRRFGRELASQLEGASRGGRGGAVVLIDLDDFQEINSSLGRQGGDQMLLAAGRALSDRMRRTDIVARLSGDTFAVLIPAVNAELAEFVGHSLVERVAERTVHRKGSATRHVTASVGVVLYAQHTELTADRLLSDAGLALDEARVLGGNCCVVRSAKQAADGRAGGRLSSQDQVRPAFDEDRLVLYAQPMLDIKAGEITRYELLVRMLDENDEVILPSAFLPAAERRGTIGTIDRWVIREAIALLERRPPTADRVRLQVNVSARSLSDPGFVDYLRGELMATDADAAELVLEITETAAIANIDDARQLLKSISELGCGVTLDDVGADLASNHHLGDLPFDEVKIDGHFIRNLTTNPGDLVLVETIVRLSRGLGKRTLAEYVEDAATLKLIRDVGVDYAQGHYVGKPAPAQRLICGAGSARP